MSSHLLEPERWVERPARDGSAEGSAGATLRRVKQATEPSEAAVEALARRLHAPQARVTRTPLAWRVAVASGVLISMCGFVGAAHLVHRWQARSRAASVPAAPAAPPARKRGAHAAVASAVAVEPAVPVVEPAVSVVAPALVAPPSPPVEISPRATHRAPRSPAPLEEADLLAEAFRALRSGGDPAAALRALDEHDRRFSAGALASEARTARAEALLALDRRAEAFALLANIADAGALTRDVLVTRGELFADAGRCVEATRDFERALVISAADALGGRALYGRASCRLRADEIPGARDDLQRYLALHPDGAFAPAARRALEAMP